MHILLPLRFLSVFPGSFWPKTDSMCVPPYPLGMKGEAGF